MSEGWLARVWERLRGPPAPAPGRPDWREVQRVLTAALDLPPAGRAGFLDRACAREEGLRREVESLLAAHDRATLLDRPVPGPPTRPARGLRVANYRILEKLGGGGMGVVYQARDTRLERMVALKFLPPHLSADERAKERFLVEARAAAALDHPNICTVHEVGETDDGHLFLAMPFYEGETLRQRIARGPLPPEEAAGVALQVARGLAKAHERGIVHRDVKPANLIVAAEGVVKIVDFGVAKLAHMSAAQPRDVSGTPAYMSPEQVRREEVDGRTDLWALGVVLYEMLTGERPFRGTDDGALVRSILAAEPEPIGSRFPGVPLALEAVAMRALAKPPHDRFGTAEEMAEALEGALEGARGAAAPEGAPADAGVLPEGERRRATIVAATLSGCDAIMESLPPAELEAWTARMREEAEAVAARHGGALNRLAGEEMVLLFGIPASHEDDPVRAVRAALELRERVRAVSRGIEARGGGPLRAHAGIDSGRVVAHGGGGEGSVFRVAGPPARRSARLAARAGPDEVWVSAECHAFVAPFFRTLAGEPLAGSDPERPLVPYRVLGESGLRTRLEAAEKAGLTAFAGREAELATLDAGLASARRGEGRLVVVVGEPGMGKSRLLREFRERHRDEPVSFLRGRCQSYGGAVAYLPFLEILRTALGLEDAGAGASPERAIERVLDLSPGLAEFVPLYLHLLSIPDARHPVPKRLQGDALRLAIQEAVAELLTASARRRPAVVLLDDWHWADEASGAVLRGIAERLADQPILAIVTTRPGYGVEPGDPGRHAAVPLRPLEPSFSAEMLRSLLGVARFPEELGALLYERTGGNPFFLEEVCQTLVEEGAVLVEGGEARLAGPLRLLDLPDSVQAVIRARLDRLDRGARDVLRLASVVGREFTRSVLDLTLPERETLAPALESLRAAGLVRQTRGGSEPAYRFKHILTQEVAYDTLLEHQRRDLHGRVGAAIERLHAEQIEEHLERLAHHFSRAEAWEKAIRYGLRSAARTTELAQFPEALLVLERTQRWLAKLPAGPERRDALVEILLREERLCETLGLRTRQQRIIDELIALLDPLQDHEELAEAYLRQGDLFTLLRRFPQAEGALDRSLRIRRELGDPVGERNTLRSFGLLRWHEGRNEEALGLIEQALRIDRQRQDRAAIVGDLTNLGAILRGLGEYDRARAALEEALELSEGEGAADDHSMKRVYALQHLANLHRERGDRALALDCLRRAGELALEKRLPIQLSYHFTSLAHVHLLEGDLERSLQYYHEAVDLTRRAKYAPGLAHSLRILGEVLLGLRRHGEALRALEEAVALFAQLKDEENEALMWSRIGTAREHGEDFAGAVPAWSRAAALRRQRRDAAGEMEALEGLGRALRRRMGDPSLALAHYERALELALAREDRAAEGRLRNAAGILEWERGEHAPALRHFERALALFRALGDAVHEGLMLNSVGATLLRLRRPDEARARLEEAVALHRRTGSGRLEGHALATLGDVCAEGGDPEGAGEHYRASLELRRRSGDRGGEGWMLHHLARSELALGRTGPGMELLERAGRIAEERGDAELAGECERLRTVPAR